MLETLIQQSPLAGTGLEIAYRHEMTLDHGSEESVYWLVTRKLDGARFWLKAAIDHDRRTPLIAEYRLLKRLDCSGLVMAVEDGTDGHLPHIAFKCSGEVLCTAEELARLTPLELLAFGRAVAEMVQCLETSKPPTALVRFGSAPLLISPMLKRPMLLGLGEYAETASEEPHRQARAAAWEFIAGAMARSTELAGFGSLLSFGELWVTSGQTGFGDLHQAFNAAALELATRDL